MGIIGWIVLGGLVGWIASILFKTESQLGLLGDIVAGVVGGLIGGFAMDLLWDIGSITDFNLYSQLVAMLGAIVIVGVWYMVTGRKSDY